MMSRRIESRSQAMAMLESIVPYLERERERATYYLPRITETTHRGEREWDIYSRLLKDRIVFVGTEIDDFVANAVIAQFLFLESEDPDKDVQMYVNSPGGVVTAGLVVGLTAAQMLPRIFGHAPVETEESQEKAAPAR